MTPSTELYAAIQRILDDPHSWPPALAPAEGTDPEELPAVYRADLSDLLAANPPDVVGLPRQEPRAFTEEELERLPHSLPVLGFPFHRLLPDTNCIWSFRAAHALPPLNRRADGSTRTAIQSPDLKVPVQIDSVEVRAGRWPALFWLAAGMGERTNRPSQAQVAQLMDEAAGSAGRWKALDFLGHPGYAMTDQGRVFRISPAVGGRAFNTRTLEAIPFEIKPYLVNGSRQFTLSVEDPDDPFAGRGRRAPAPRPKNSLAPANIISAGQRRAKLKAHRQFVRRYYLRPLYELVWGFGATPQAAARKHAASTYNPYVDDDDLDRVFDAARRRRGSPSALPDSTPSVD